LANQVNLVNPANQTSLDNQINQDIQAIKVNPINLNSQGKL